MSLLTRIEEVLAFKTEYQYETAMSLEVIERLAELLREVVPMVKQRDQLAKALQAVTAELETVLPTHGRVHSERQALIDAYAALSAMTGGSNG